MTKIFAHHQRFDFSGELNLLTSQRSLVEARTVQESRLLRIPRSELQRLMRAEGDIANLITSATIWRHIGILSTTTGYLSVIKQHLRPAWGKVQLTDIKPLEVQEWLKQINLSRKTKQNIKAVFHRMMELAVLWGLDACTEKSFKSRRDERRLRQAMSEEVDFDTRPVPASLQPSR